MYDFAGKRRWFFLTSALVILAGVISLAIFGLKPGIDFTSGSTMTISFDQPVDQEQLRDKLAELGHGDAVIQRTSGGTFLIRTRVLEPAEKADIEAELKDKFGSLTVDDFYSVSPVIAAQTVRNAGFAVLAAVVGILLYITWAFRKVPKPFRYGVCAIAALLHDVLVVMGIFSILGWLAGIEINSMFIIALLTILGYSVNDTIVVFDRIRENITKEISPSFVSTVNISLTETLGRSLNTSLTTLLVLLALFLFGGVTIHNFVLVLIIGIVSGTYSSIFIASQLLVVWEEGDIGRLFRRIRLARAGG